MRFGSVISPPITVERAIALALQYEEAGFHSLVFPDHTLMVPPGLTPNAFALMASLATKVKKAFLGTGVTDFLRYHPSIVAQFFATLNHMTQNVFLGVGAGEAMNIKPFGISWRKKFSVLKEGIEIVKKLWSEDTVSFDGEIFKLNNAFLQIKPLGKIPVYLGANGRKTRILAGEACDGWMPILETPKTYKENLKDVSYGAERAGRKIDEIDTALQIYVAIDNDSEKAMNRVRQFSGVVLSAIEKVEQAGYELNIPKDFSKRFYFEDLIPSAEMLAKFVELSSSVRDEILREFFIVGTVEEAISQIESFRKAGVKHMMIINIGPDPKFVLKTFSEHIIPSFAEI